MNWDTIIQTLVPVIITTVIIPLLVIFGKKASKFVDEQVKDTKLRKYLDLAIDCIVDSVEDVAHDFADKLSAEEWNDDTKQIALTKAKETVLTNIGSTGQEILTDALGDFDKWLETKIKAEVQRRKSAQGTTLTPLVGDYTQPQSYTGITVSTQADPNAEAQSVITGTQV
jgi:hypothetical protein